VLLAVPLRAFEEAGLARFLRRLNEFLALAGLA